MSKKPVVLMVLDGYGLSDHKEGNAIAMANTPVMDKLMAECNQNSVEVTRTVTADVLNVSVQAKPLRSVILSRMEEDEQEKKL